MRIKYERKTSHSNMVFLMTDFLRFSAEGLVIEIKIENTKIIERIVTIW